MKKRPLGAGLALVLPMLLTAPAATAHVLVGTMLTPNWSGYALAGRAFSGVTGTFNIPVQLKSGSCLDETAVWVGVDGLDNHDLLQAGIVESGFALPTSSGSPEGPTPGIKCLDRAQVYGFWEDLPSAPVRVDLPVRLGDVVSVAMFKMSPGWWALAIHDLTAGQSFFLSQPYAAPRPQWNGWSRSLGSWACLLTQSPSVPSGSATSVRRAIRAKWSAPAAAPGGSRRAELGGECDAADGRRFRCPLGR